MDRRARDREISAGRGGRWFLRLLTAAALAIDAYIHADLAANYDPITQSISQGDLFRIEAGVSSFAAVLLILSASRIVWGFAFLVLASGLGALVLYRYVDVGVLGPLPNMYEPVWFTEKSVAAVAEAVGVLASLAGFVAGPRRRTSHVDGY
jgi:hypothetical protein